MTHQSKKIAVFNWRQAVLADPELPTFSRAIALVISTYMNDYHDTSWPAIKTIREQLNIGSNSTVIKYVKILADAGYLTVTKRFGNSNIYTAQFPSITPPVVLHEMDSSITPRVTSVLHHVEPNNQSNNQSNNLVPTVLVDASASTCPHQKIVDLYHKHFPAGPKVKEITPKRKKALKARWVNGASELEYWEDYFRHAATSPFLTGKNNRNWRADFDFFIRPDTSTFMQEGKYHK